MSVQEPGPTVDELQGRIAAYLARRLDVPDVTLDGFRRHTEGFSWETYSMFARWLERDGSQTKRGFVLHRKPDAGLMPDYDAAGLHALLGSLRDVEDVPVAGALWCDPEGEALGRPMYVVEKIEGDSPVPWTVASYFTGDDARHDMGRQFTALGAAIHRVPLERLPGGLLGMGADDPVAVIIDHWESLYRRNRLEPYPAADYVFSWLRHNMHLTSGRVGLVHGDFRIGNFMIRDERIAAMLDWETAHIGDPVEDLAVATLKSMRGGRTGEMGGMLPLDEFLALYEEHAGFRVPRCAIQYWWILNSAAGVAQWATAMRHYESRRTRDARYPTVGYQIFAYSIKDAFANIEALRSGEPPWPS